MTRRDYDAWRDFVGIRRPVESDSDDDSESPPEYYTGGEKRFDFFPRTLAFLVSQSRDSVSTCPVAKSVNFAGVRNFLWDKSLYFGIYLRFPCLVYCGNSIDE